LTDVYRAMGLLQVYGTNGKVDVGKLEKFWSTKLKALEPVSNEYKKIQTYVVSMSANAGNLSKIPSVRGIYAVTRQEHQNRPFFNSAFNRKLLWYGLPLASVGAVLTDGLKIDTHCADRVGKG